MLTFLGVQKCASCEIGYHRDRNIRARSLKNGSILNEDVELRNEVTVLLFHTHRRYFSENVKLLASSHPWDLKSEI
jgi:hypothetical protein